MPGDGFTVETSLHPDGFTVRWAGEADLRAASNAVESVAVLGIAEGDSVRLVLDRVTFIDSSGVRGLLNIQSYVEGAGATLELVDPPVCVTRVLELSGLLEILGLETAPGA